jgi:oxygen-independent coproporphyrinogen-3 oxidase
MKTGLPHSTPCPPHVYVHVPFCGRRCSYCDFSIAVRRQIPVARFIDAIKAELATRGVGSAVSGVGSIYFGGGTPSKLGAGLSELTNLISTRAGVPASSIGEITVECNPEDLSVGVVASWRDAGINRVSLGVQSFDDAVLAWMHRTHTAADARRSVEFLVAGGMENFSLDLIFALPDGLARNWRADLDAALEMRPKHLSLYGLTVEPHTPLGRWTEGGRAAVADEEKYEAEFLEADRVLRAAGFVHYEVSNYALPGFEAVHNSAYWSGAEYLGLGPSAHGFDGETRRWNQREYTRWLDLVESGRDPVEGDETLWPAELEAERIYLGLRTSQGLRATDEEFARAARWIESGWATRDGDRLILTPLGWLRLDSLAAALVAG